MTAPKTPARPRRPGNGRSQAREVASAGEPIGGPIPGSSLVVHKFEGGALAGRGWIDGTGGELYDTVNSGRGAREIASALMTWTEDMKLKSGVGGGSTIFDRNAYVPPDNIFDQMRMASRAVENDDVVGGAADTTEGLALEEVHFEHEELDEADVFNQWAQLVDLDSFIRACWRELFTNSQYIAARWPGFRDFKVSGRTKPNVDDVTGEIKKGQKRKAKKEAVYCPIGLTVLDSTKVVPLGSLMFGQERLVWTASELEMATWTAINNGDAPKQSDPIVASIFLGPYTPSSDERAMLSKLGINTAGQGRLLEMNPTYVWRHTLTRQHYKPWADLRLKRVFRWMDLKQQLLAADRVALVGQANYILLIRKGEKDKPAQQPELDALNEQFAYIARLPVVIGDHTLQIDIITPKQEFTLKQERYSTVDQHILDSVLQTFRDNSRGERDTTLTLARAIARGLSNRRRGMKRDFEANLGRWITEHPFNEGKFTADPNLVFSPRNINLDIDQYTAQAILLLEARGDLSRETTLEEFGFDQATEAQRRTFERDYMDPIFRSATPHDSPLNNPQGDPRAGDTPAGKGGAALPPGQGGGGRPPGKPAKTQPASPQSGATS